MYCLFRLIPSGKHQITLTRSLSVTSSSLRSNTCKTHLKYSTTLLQTESNLNFAVVASYTVKLKPVRNKTTKRWLKKHSLNSVVYIFPFQDRYNFYFCNSVLSSIIESTTQRLGKRMILRYHHIQHLFCNFVGTVVSNPIKQLN